LVQASKSVLFVCLGNICRSPAAEGVMQELINAQGLTDTIHVDSAGTSGYHIDAPADKRMRAAAQARGINLTSRSRMVSPRDLVEFDLIVAMDRTNYRELLALSDGSHNKIRMLSDYLDASWPRDVPDPYYGGDAGFEEVLNMLEVACPKMLKALTQDEP
jgi:protein-tyrosine phosphatase